MRHQQSMGREGQTDLHRMNKMSEEKKSEVTEEVKEARKLSVEELEQVNGGAAGPKVEGVIGSAAAAGIIFKNF